MTSIHDTEGRRNAVADLTRHVEERQLDAAQVQHIHADMVSKLVKPGIQIGHTLTPALIDLWHGATGVCGEAGELIDAVKKSVVYGKPLDRENCIEELGDIEFYLEQVRQNLGVTREECLAANCDKLVYGPNARFPNGYTDQAAQARADKAPGE
jgi:NTP pyrophosphatase (non-canonical NTP hydrolase)